MTAGQKTTPLSVYHMVWGQREDCLFPTTTWTIVTAAGRHSTGSPDALAKLGGAYWLAVCAFIRRRGYPREEAEDLCQDSFVWILERGALAAAQREGGALAAARRERGKFRSFPLAALGRK